MKKVLLVLILFITSFCKAQNYQCLQAGVKNYFINGNGYLRGIRIDSVRTLGDTTVYYPFHTPRGQYSPGFFPILDSNGGSWLGKKVLQLNDGTFIFDSYWNDSVILKTQANIGDSWVFYKDTSSLYYEATVISNDTMTVLSSPDSIKTIMINAYNGSGIVTSDPLNSFNIILSKNNGFVQVFDLYTFPYHKPDSSYREGLDFFLDQAATNSSPNANTATFLLVDFIAPNAQQLFNWNTGDILESDHQCTSFPPSNPYSMTTDYILDTITDKVISGHSINYTLSGEYYSCLSGFFPCSLISNTGLYSFSDSYFPIADTGFMPEDLFPVGNYISYFPYDTNYCLLSPAYTITPARYDGLSPRDWTNYKLGIGKTYYEWDDNDDQLYESDKLLYYNINGISCGNPRSERVNNISLQPYQFQLFPNPTSTSLTIASTDKITSIAITNLIGQTLFTHEYNSAQVQVDVADLPTGIYFVKINGTEVRKFAKE